MLSLWRITDTPTVGARSKGNCGSFCLALFGGTRTNGPSIATGCWSISAFPFFSSPDRGTSVLPREWSPQQRWICTHTKVLESDWYVWFALEPSVHPPWTQQVIIPNLNNPCMLRIRTAVKHQFWAGGICSLTGQQQITAVPFWGPVISFLL